MVSGESPAISLTEEKRDFNSGPTPASTWKIAGARRRFSLGPGSGGGGFSRRSLKAAEVGEPRGSGCGKREAEGSGLKPKKFTHSRVGRERRN